MRSHLLAASNPHTPSSSSSGMMKNAAALLLRSEHDSAADSTSIFMPSSSEIEQKPLIPRTPSYANDKSTPDQKRKQRRRRETSVVTLSLGGTRRRFGRMTIAPSETFLITRLTFKLLGLLGVGYRWIMRFMALGFYAFLLMPGFIQVGYYYFYSNRIRRSIVYGEQPRNRLDLYLPVNKDGAKPVVAFVTGGAWIIGYKAWGSLLGLQLSDRDIIVACIDYRNFPQGTIGEMVQDAAEGISFVCNNIAAYGGDPNRIYVMGQSAGAHIASCTLLQQAMKEAAGETTTWSVSQIKYYFGLSGGYNLFNLVDHFHSRGLYRSIFLGIMEGEESLHRYSPEVVARDPNTRNAVSLLPPIILFHGTDDYSIPSDASTSFSKTLRDAGAQSESILYEGKTHTDLFLQDPMRGGKDDLFEDLIRLIHGDDAEALAKDVTAPPRRRLVPECMLRLARKVSPF
ncbi:probable isoprenylcysteine alpha-carbonyl methylesterase ICMEL2 [Salvia miltiorrhiza]|uniref:probable isoprenylcysteine alpha-carbonyl methylesterase ICMEL2 n=1 Tax=Salvia miltiorrhiza TaxID=226208 RepID=UPI0025ABE007|nr:probable isoprenylcysteine alpha-carbonyl methylesterase ICMEL2 [Salvia miltiorrhiza]